MEMVSAVHCISPLRFYDLYFVEMILYLRGSDGGREGAVVDQ